MAARIRPQVFQGIPASPGIAIGNAVLVKNGRLAFDQFHVPEQEVVPEQKRLRNALTTAGRELSALQERVVEDGGEHPYILEPPNPHASGPPVCWRSHAADPGPTNQRRVGHPIHGRED